MEFPINQLMFLLLNQTHHIFLLISFIKRNIINVCTKPSFKSIHFELNLFKIGVWKRSTSCLAAADLLLQVCCSYVVFVVLSFHIPEQILSPLTTLERLCFKEKKILPMASSCSLLTFSFTLSLCMQENLTFCRHFNVMCFLTLSREMLIIFSYFNG